MKTTLIVIILIIIAAGAVWYWSRPAQAPENVQTPTPTAPAPTASANPSVLPALEPKSVSIINFSFVPETLTVKKGDKIIFVNKDAVPHTVTASGKFDSGILQTGGSYLLDTTKLAAGTYPYACTIHPSIRGTLIVQ